MDYEPEMLLSLVAELSQKYTAGDSSSITWEKAQSLMGAVIYCLEEYRNFRPNAPADREISLKEQYQAGYELVQEKVRKSLALYNQLSTQFDDYGVRALHDTIQKGIPSFLKWYDAKFCPQNTIIMLDYPLLSTSASLQGVDAIYEYICAIQLEQRFLHMLDKDYVLFLLRKQNFDYPNMPDNICDVILPDIIGHLAIAKPFTGTGFQAEEYGYLTKIFENKSLSDMEAMITHLLKIVVEQSFDNDAGMLAYLSVAGRNIAVRIDTAIRFHHLDRLFLF